MDIICQAKAADLTGGAEKHQIMIAILPANFLFNKICPYSGVVRARKTKMTFGTKNFSPNHKK
jgi:hypothetical protein